MSRIETEISRIRKETAKEAFNVLYKQLADGLRHTTLLVSGATGMLGAQTVYTLLALNEMYSSNIRVIALARNLEKIRKVFAPLKGNPLFTYLQADVRTPLKIEEPIHYMIHMAGVTGGSKQHIDTPMTTIHTAIDGTLNMLELAKRHAVKGFVYLSSLEIYGKTDYSMDSIPEDYMGYLDCTSVRSSYPESKRMCECICSSYAKQYDVPAVIARLTATFGPGVSYEDGRVFAQFARSVIEKHDIVLRSKGDTERNYCDASDAVNAFLLLLLRGERGEAYNVANPDTAVSIREMAELFIRCFPEAGIRLRFDLAENIENLGYRGTIKTKLDSRKLQSLGWFPYYNMEEMVWRLVHDMGAYGI